MDDGTNIPTLLDCAFDSCFTTTEDGTIVGLNTAAEMVFSRAREQAIGRPLSDLIDPVVSPAELNRHRVELSGIRGDGSRVPIEVSVCRIEMDGVVRYAAWMRDLSERYDAAEALRSAEARLRQAHKMEAVGRLAGGVAHDFNNVLTAIFGYADLLLDGLGADDPKRPDVEEIKRAASRAAALTRQLLAFSRKQVLQPKRVNLNEIVDNVKALLAKLVGCEIELRVECDPSVGDVKADPGQLEQVLMNLATNSRDALPKGGRITIATVNQDIGPAEAAMLPGLAPGRFVRLTVSDTGHGIPDAVRAQIFEPFFTTKEQGKGTGLGLATVYGIVKQSGGWIYLNEAPGAGASFSIYLPRLDATSSL
ncbi:MAG TPA: ATP-binding protein [Vicinamibacterales bacterium]|nr:ATP-binding protein [Vicinamibacterales bacterium]